MHFMGEEEFPIEKLLKQTLSELISYGTNMSKIYHQNNSVNANCIILFR